MAGPTRDLGSLLEDDLEEIESACLRYEQGQLSAYQTVAIQLRNLLTDRDRRSGPLLERVVPGATFEALKDPVETDSGPQHLGGNQYSVTVLAFDARGHIALRAGATALWVPEVLPDRLVTVQSWIDDWVIRPEIRIGTLIHEVASKDAAHTDDDAGETMGRLEQSLIYAMNGQQIPFSRPVIVGIGNYVARRARELLTASNGDALGMQRL
ncbi:MAG: hypothetical protein O2924_03180 [Chloroflexi bacterium]|nr:hypothetical protein [Chloroflexota bacterium]